MAGGFPAGKNKKRTFLHAPICGLSSSMSNQSPRTAAPQLSGTRLPARLAEHSDGPPSWTSERQAAFLSHLAATHNVARAARSVGMSRQSAYRLRARLHGEPFDRAWAAAFQCHFDALAEAAMERALNGVEVPHYHKGELIGTSRRYDERLTLGLLAMRQSFWRCEPEPMSAADAFASDDIAGLIARVADGPEAWNDAETRDEEIAYWATPRDPPRHCDENDWCGGTPEDAAPDSEVSATVSAEVSAGRIADASADRAAGDGAAR